MKRANIFSPEELDRIVKDTIPENVTAGDKNAIVTAVDKEGAKVVAHFVLDKTERWSVDGVYQHTWSGDNNVGGRVIFSW